MPGVPTFFDETELFLKGLTARREVLGDAFVERALDGADAFDAPMQQLATEHAWGAIWARSGLERKIRSLLNVAMMAVLHRPAELETHARGALTNGATAQELQEVLLQVAVYAGVPTGMGAFRVVAPVVRAHLSKTAGAT